MGRIRPSFVKIRAIEEAIPFIRVANTGISSVTNALGSTVFQTSYGIRTFATSKLPKKLQIATIYASYNVYINLFILLISIAIPLFYANKNQS